MTGISRKTVINDLRPQVVETPPPVVDHYSPPQHHPLEDVAAEVDIALDDDDEPALTEAECKALDRAEMLTDSEEADAIEAEVQAARITGTDGKSYPKPEPRPQQRKSLPDVFWHACYDLTKGAERIARLSEDDRFRKNTDQISQRNLPDLIRARDALQRVIDQLNGKQPPTSSPPERFRQSTGIAGRAGRAERPII